MNHKVDIFISEAKNWKLEMAAIRRIVLDCGLTEEWKWKQPCYTYNGKNIAIIGAFKDYCVLSFFKGVLLQDSNKVLLSPGKNSQSARFLKFLDLKSLLAQEKLIKEYIFEAIEVEKAGLKVDFKDSKDITLIEELQNALNENLALKEAFYALTPGRQRGYNIYFSAPKQSKTRISRIDSFKWKILSGKGFHDCTCGLSKRMPTCDGSHKNI